MFTYGAADHAQADPARTAN